jgi:hypothetical protein
MRKTEFNEETLTAMPDDDLEMMCNRLNPPVKTHEDPVKICVKMMIGTMDGIVHKWRHH